MRVCSCPHCGHPTAVHGTAVIPAGDRRVTVFVCLDCATTVCLATVIAEAPTTAVYAYVLDGDAHSGVGGLYLPGIGLVLAMSADRDGLRSQLPWAVGTAMQVGRRMRLVRVGRTTDGFTAETVDLDDT